MLKQNESLLKTKNVWLEITFEQVGILTFNVFVKVRKNQKQIMCSSFPPKNEQKDLTSFCLLREEVGTLYLYFLENMRTKKFASGNFWPLTLGVTIGM